MENTEVLRQITVKTPGRRFKPRKIMKNNCTEPGWVEPSFKTERSSFTHTENTPVRTSLLSLSAALAPTSRNISCTEEPVVGHGIPHVYTLPHSVYLLIVNNLGANMAHFYEQRCEGTHRHVARGKGKGKREKGREMGLKTKQQQWAKGENWFNKYDIGIKAIQYNTIGIEADK